VDGADVLADVVDGIADGSAVAVPQEGQPTYATKLALEDGRIRWDRPRGAVLAQIRGVTPEPGAFTMLGDARLKVLAAHEADADVPRREPGEISTAGGVVVAGTADAPIVLERVQPAGKSAMAAQDWWRGLRAADSVIAS
jgi:methionyl-tRNA formyltransferase